MTRNAPARTTAPTDESLNTLSGIANDCCGVDAFRSCTDRADARYVVCADSVVRGLESAYDIILITDFRLSQATVHDRETEGIPERHFHNLNHLLIAFGVFVCVFEQRIAELQPPATRSANRVRALRDADDVFAARSLALPLLIALVCWLSIIFGTFGLLAPRNGTMVVAYPLCAF